MSRKDFLLILFAIWEYSVKVSTDNDDACRHLIDIENVHLKKK